nr:carboxypeptidase-like regulatory domain-containing protein [uncultured Flavobacterium sp.]
MSRTISFLFCLVAANVLAQQSVPTQLEGKVNANMLDLEGIYIINLKTEKAAITDADGYYSIQAAVGDTLLFSSVQFKSVTIVLTPEYFQKERLIVKMEPIMNQLKEVVIRRYDNINAVSLGIIPKGQKSYTQAERKLRTATSGGGIDGLLNLFSGRTAMLKKELAVEKKESYLALLEQMFDKSHFTNTLNIPSEYVKGFEYYAVENDKFTKILSLKNRTTVEFLLGELAIQYNDTIACEK